jgi:anti-anti-sigma factor
MRCSVAKKVSPWLEPGHLSHATVRQRTVVPCFVAAKSVSRTFTSPSEIDTSISRLPVVRDLASKLPPLQAIRLTGRLLDSHDRALVTRFRFVPEYFEAVDAAQTNHDRGETEMPEYRHLEVLSLGPVSRVRILNHRRFYDEEEVAELTNEWNSITDRTDCHAFFVDCSDVQFPSSEMLSRLILLDRRLKQKERELMLCGLSPEFGAVLRRTKLDQLITIKEDEGQELIASE